MSKPTREDELLSVGLCLDERAGPARRISRDQALSMVESALDTFAGEQPEFARAPNGALRQAVAPRRRSLLPALAVAASLLLAIVGGASAARWYFGKAVAPKPELAAPVTQTVRPKRVQPTELPEVTLQAELPEEASDTRAPARASQRPREVSKAEPDDLLQRANRLRAEGRFQSAADTYQEVYERYPRSLSAYAAQVAAASIELEHLGKPDHARKLFESALRSHPHGALDLEARQGLSLALRDLGRDRDEAASLRALIRDHSESAASRRAEARLKELTDAP